jgi:glycosyltransferase involved in cell wall biosynthesis
MPPTIMQVAYPFAPVGRDCVGGAEQILAACDEAAVRAGYRSIVVACEGSQVAGDLIAVSRVARADDPDTRARAHAEHRRAITTAVSKRGVDLVHCHGLDFGAYLPPQGIPVLVTLHLDASSYDEKALQTIRPGTHFNGVSESQHRSCPAIPNLLGPVINGVDVERLQPDPQVRRTHALVLARICPEKGIHLAIDAAKQADADLGIAGEVFRYAEHERYFTEEIEPRLDGRRVFLGPAGFGAKRKLLQCARCLLVPSLIEETSSLVAMEALACGTPVIAFRRGALAEIIQHGVTGALVDDIAEMAAAIANVHSLRAADCVSSARHRFNARRMTQDYLRLYEKLGARSPLRQLAEQTAS